MRALIARAAAAALRSRNGGAAEAEAEAASGSGAAAAAAASSAPAAGTTAGIPAQLLPLGLAGQQAEEAAPPLPPLVPATGTTATGAAAAPAAAGSTAERRALSTLVDTAAGLCSLAERSYISTGRHPRAVAAAALHLACAASGGPALPAAEAAALLQARKELAPVIHARCHFRTATNRSSVCVVHSSPRLWPAGGSERSEPPHRRPQGTPRAISKPLSPTAHAEHRCVAPPIRPRHLRGRHALKNNPAMRIPP